ncbi:MAG TPA: LD-carboxypeptidase [Solirubrobacterales bacterium]|nr:LD-carboxypeptidase [Solirubrobacterales bacterium]
MPRIAPRGLRAGASIAVVACSTNRAHQHPDRLANACTHLAEMGFEVVLGDSVRRRDVPGAAELAAELEGFAADPSIGAVVSLIGGWGCNRLLPHIDFAAIARSRPTLIGYSDFTALLVAVSAATGLGTIYGPALLPQFGDEAPPDDYTRETLLRACELGDGVLCEFPSYQLEAVPWGPGAPTRRREPAAAPSTLREGTASGPLLGGNIASLLTLAGTPYWPDLAGAVLLLEASSGTSAALLRAQLAQLAQLGCFAQAAAVLIGRFARSELADPSLAESVLREVRWSQPVAWNLPFGHTDPVLSLPLLATASVELAGTVRLRLTEPMSQTRPPSGSPTAPLPMATTRGGGPMNNNN